MDFDETRIYYSHQALQKEQNDEDAPEDNDNGDEEQVDLNAVRRHFREFLRNYRQGLHRFLYRERLLRMHRRDGTKLEIDLAHVGEYDPGLLGYLLGQPSNVLGPLELAAMDALKSLLFDQREDTSEDNTPANTTETTATTAPITAVNDDLLFAKSSIQILLKGNLALTPLRHIKSEHMNKLLKCPGIVISTSPVKSRATLLQLRCSKCFDALVIPVTGGPFAGVQLPRTCVVNPKECGLFPYSVVPDDSHFVDRQSWKLQESPETVPTGEMPRSIVLAVERSLVDKAPPGTRLNAICIPTLFTTGKDSVKTVYLRVVGLERDHAPGESATFTPREEEAFRRLAARNDVYDILSRSVAPSISGDYTVDIKKAIVCMLMGGSRKRLPDGVRLRGDINVLLLGDPSTAKSQFLKFASSVAPIGIYTSGKGSSAAGLTASVVKDSRGEFYLEGGAMVLADGGIVAIDEFDKMRPQDRVAIHEAMEQQTISIAKAGITTVLNSRSSVLAAANPIFGRYDDLKTAAEQIDLMTTILSRFDLIFLVRDVREEERDRMICQHVMGVHMSNSRGSGLAKGLFGQDNSQEQSGGNVMDTSSAAEAIAENVLRLATTGQGELDMPSMKKYIQYCKYRCSPRLSEQAGEQLAAKYVQVREGVRKNAKPDEQPVIPITVRQLEALVRLSESLAKMRLQDEVQIEDVETAYGLFERSTMAANQVDRQETNWSAVQQVSDFEFDRAEGFLRSRLSVGSMVNKQRLLQEATQSGYDPRAIAKALGVMVGRGELQEHNKGKMMRRIK